LQFLDQRPKHFSHPEPLTSSYKQHKGKRKSYFGTNQLNQIKIRAQGIRFVSAEVIIC
jgi:hypothetical protein